MPIFEWEFEFQTDIANLRKLLVAKTFPWRKIALASLPWNRSSNLLRLNGDQIFLFRYRPGIFPWSTPHRYRFEGKVGEANGKVIMTGFYRPAPEVRFTFYFFSAVIFLFLAFLLVFVPVYAFENGFEVRQFAFAILLAALLAVSELFIYWFLVRPAPSLAARHDLLDMLQNLSVEVSFKEKRARG